MEHRFGWQGKECIVRLESSREGSRAWIDGRERQFRVLRWENGVLGLELDGRVRRVAFVRDGALLHLACDGIPYRLEKIDSLRRQRALQHHEHPLEAPMPGQVLSVPVREGENVRLGQTLVVLEAMKMEIRITAPEPARVARLRCAAGEQVERGQVLVELDTGLESRA